MSRPQAGGSLGRDVPLSRCHARARLRESQATCSAGWGEGSQPCLPSPATQPQQGPAPRPGVGGHGSSSPPVCCTFRHISGTARSAEVKAGLPLCCERRFPSVWGRGAARSWENCLLRVHKGARVSGLVLTPHSPSGVHVTAAGAGSSRACLGEAEGVPQGRRRWHLDRD